MKPLLPIALLVLAWMPGASRAATFANGGFELGDLSGWTATPGLVEIVSQSEDAVGPPIGETYLAPEGQLFAQLSTGREDGGPTTLSRTFHVSAPTRVAGFAAFLAFDYLPYDDEASIRIVGLQSQEMFRVRISDPAVGDFGRTPWTYFESDILEAGTYTFVAMVSDSGEVGGPSRLLLDGVALPAAAPVPEPATWSLLLAGFLVSGAWLRTCRRVVPLN